MCLMMCFRVGDNLQTKHLRNPAGGQRQCKLLRHAPPAARRPPSRGAPRRYRPSWWKGRGTAGACSRCNQTASLAAPPPWHERTGVAWFLPSGSYPANQGGAACGKGGGPNKEPGPCGQGMILSAIAGVKIALDFHCLGCIIQPTLNSGPVPCTAPGPGRLQQGPGHEPADRARSTRADATALGGERWTGRYL